MPPAGALSGSGSANTVQPLSVLVVDDDAGSLLVAQAAVERSGHECLTAVDGQAYRNSAPRLGLIFPRGTLREERAPLSLQGIPYRCVLEWPEGLIPNHH